MIDNDYLEDMLYDVQEDYRIQYKIMDYKGQIDYLIHKIYLNPQYNEDLETLAHELCHYYHDIFIGDGMGIEDLIEYESKELLDEPWRSTLENYLEKELYGKT